MEQLKSDAPKIMGNIAVGEGLYAVKQARLICKNDKIVNTGTYRRNWKCDTSAKRSGKKYIVRFYNPIDYASHLEYGFRSHFVPGYWDGNSFVYDRNADSGMYVGPRGGFVRGHYTMKRAVKRTSSTQQARITRKIDAELKRRFT